MKKIKLDEHCKCEVVTFLVFNVGQFQLYFNRSFSSQQFEKLLLRDVICTTIGCQNYSWNIADTNPQLKTRKNTTSHFQ